MRRGSEGACTNLAFVPTAVGAYFGAAMPRAMRGKHAAVPRTKFADKLHKLHLSCTNYALCCKFRYLPKQNLLYMLLITSSCASVPVISPSFSHALRMREEMTSKVSCGEPSRRISAV